MTLDLIQLAFYAAFALLGWWLSKRGLLPNALLPTSNSQAPSPVPVNLDQQMLVALLKAVLDRAPPQNGNVSAASNVFHVPIEVSANPKQPVAANPP